MQRRYITTDVFTDRAFGGNPLAVILDAGGLSTAQMQAIASEFNYVETTFVLPPRDHAHDAQVRIFTVRSEIPFAGRPNVGTAFVLATQATKPLDAVRSAGADVLPRSERPFRRSRHRQRCRGRRCPARGLVQRMRW
jgi:PhzF family phenazine biosynthesis protein